MRVRSILVLAATGIALAVIAAALPQAASASASGIQGWGFFTMSVGGQNIGVPSGQLAHRITGRGVRVNAETSSYASVGTICNWRIDYRYSDTNGRNYYINRGGIHETCNRYGERNIYVGRNMRTGQACAELFTNGRFVVRQCHNITR